MRRAAVGFIVCLGFVSLFSDVTYEGARSISGPFLATLGAGGATVGFLAGFGELVAYGLRYASGRFADATRRYWTLLLLGYGLNLAAVPLLALAGNWQTAAVLLILERLGKAIRSPSKDALLSHATSQTGRGWGFALHEAMDQFGALCGPLLMAYILHSRASYPLAFAILAIPAACALATLLTGRFLYPTPTDFEPHSPAARAVPMPRAFWVYTIGAALLGFGYADFSLIAFHAKSTALVGDATIPVLYATAMAVDGLAALALGRWFDRNRLAALLTGASLGVLAAPLAFLGGWPGLVAGMVLWGAGMGAQESVLRAALASFIPPGQRATAYGAFHAAGGVLWFCGSLAMGALYEVSLPALALLAVTAQILALATLYRAEMLHQELVGQRHMG
jgi:MFS family permease